jgi:hypothetical protein
MKYLFTPYAMWHIYENHFSKVFKELFPQEDSFRVFQSAKKEYKRIVLSIPQFDRDDDMNIIILNASVLISIYKNMKTKPSIEEVTKFYEISMLDSIITRIHMRNMNVFSNKYQNKLRNSAEKSNKRDNPFAWKYKYEAGKDISLFSAYYYQCGICKLASVENVKEIVPALCAFDYPMAKLMGSEFQRSMTLAKGGECCDCHYQKKTNG